MNIETGGVCIFFYLVLLNDAFSFFVLNNELKYWWNNTDRVRICKNPVPVPLCPP